MAVILAKSDLVPKDYKGKPENCLVAMQWGAEIGMGTLQALQNIAVINGRPSMWGDAVLALVLSSPACEYVSEDANDFDGGTAICRAKRKGSPEHVVTFSQADAIAAGLAGKTGPWQQYPKRMRQMRARAFALRDKFADVLRGLSIAEEAMDAPSEIYMGDADVIRPKDSAAKSAEAKKESPAWMSDADFGALAAKLTPRLQSGAGSHDEAIAWINARGAAKAIGMVTPEQEARIRAIGPKKFDMLEFDEKLSNCASLEDTEKLSEEISKMKLTQEEMDTVSDAIARRELDFK